MTEDRVPTPRTQAGRDLIDAPFTVARITDFDPALLERAIRDIEDQAVRTGFGWGLDSFGSEQPAPPLDADDDMTRLAAEILRFTGGCEKPHRNGERNPHVHIETTHRWGQRLVAIAREQPVPPLDVERLAPAYHAYRAMFPGGEIYCGSESGAFEFDSGPCSCRMDMEAVVRFARLGSAPSRSEPEEPR